MFVTLNLPSLLAPGNLPALARDVETTYVIGTSVTDGKVIRRSPAFQMLKKIARVRVITYRDRDFGHPVETHMKIWNNAVKVATRSRSILMTNPADMVWADGSFGHIGKLLTSGKKAIYAMFARVVDTTFRDELLRQSGSVIKLAPRDMMEMTLRHLHPFHAAYLRDSDQFPFHTEYVYWHVPGEGLLMRSLATTVLAFRAGEYAVNSQFSLAAMPNRDEVAFIADSDDVCGVSLTPLMKDRSWYTMLRTLDIDEVGGWWLSFDGPAHIALAQTKFRFHNTEPTEALWRRAEQRSDFLVLQSIIARETTRFCRLLLQSNFTRAAEFLATGLFAARLRRRWHCRGPVTIFVPENAAFETVSAGCNLEYLLHVGKEKQLADFLFGHVVPGDLQSTLDDVSNDSAAVQELDTLNGRRVSLQRAKDGTTTVGGRRIIGQIPLPLGNRVYVVDGILPSADLARDGPSRQSVVSRGTSKPRNR